MLPSTAFDLGGANLTWYERPDGWWIHRPQMRSVSTSSGTCPRGGGAVVAACAARRARRAW
eukprot:3659424-Prymnesium_polylepis.1